MNKFIIRNVFCACLSKNYKEGRTKMFTRNKSEILTFETLAEAEKFIAEEMKEYQKEFNDLEIDQISF